VDEHPASSASAPLLSIDVALAGCAFAAAVAVVVMPLVLQPAYAAMFRDFGAQETLPAFTRFALLPWFGVPFTLPTLGALAVLRATRRRRWAVIALVTSVGGLLAGVGLFMVATYLPIFTMADQIKAN
jgi:membrane protease YdiL (CAAX protease family)